jgi:hypothetical protein
MMSDAPPAPIELAPRDGLDCCGAEPLGATNESERLGLLAKALYQRGSAANTTRGYAGDIARFESWCRTLARCPEPAGEETLEDWTARGYSCEEALLPRPFGAYAREGDARPVGVLIDDGAAPIRRLREVYRNLRLESPRPAQIPGWSTAVAMPVCDTRVWSLFVGDVVEPYEDEGLVPFP